MTAVEKLYNELKDASDILENGGEISLHVALDGQISKTLLLSAASNFETRLTREVLRFVKDFSEDNELLASLVESKAINRQYHTWFNWSARNANQFFGMFGEKFKQYMTEQVSNDQHLADSIKSFLEIGELRNKLVHSDYASFLLNKTHEEIFDLYKNASTFVDRFYNFLAMYCKSVTQSAE